MYTRARLLTRTLTVISCALKFINIAAANQEQISQMNTALISQPLTSIKSLERVVKPLQLNLVLREDSPKWGALTTRFGNFIK